MTAQSVHDAIANGDQLLWIAVDGTVLEAAATSTFITYEATKTKVIGVPLLGGHKRNYWLHFQDKFAEYGKQNGCEYMEGYLRPGWIGMHRKKSGGVLGNDWADCWTVARRKL